MIGIRDLVKVISPRFLGGDNPVGNFHAGERFMYSMVGLPSDMNVNKAQEGMYARLPLRADPTALPYLGRDRAIVRGVNESDATYAIRLTQAIDAWRHAGSDRGIMSQVIPYVGMSPMARIVSSSIPYTTWTTYVADADVTQAPSPLRVSLNWDWDSAIYSGAFFGWWRAWLILFAVSPHDFAHPAATWGSGKKWGDSTFSWGLDIPATEVESMRAIVKQWKRAGSWFEWILISFDDTIFRPSQPADGIHNPDGTWGRWSKEVAGVRVPARSASARYIDGVA